MKRIIEGLRYDTETATFIGRDRQCNGSFSDWDESLYVTKSGNYFISGSGGAASRWAEPSGDNGRQGGSGIRPLTREEALQWAESHLTTDEVEAHFGDSIKDA